MLEASGILQERDVKIAEPYRHELDELVAECHQFLPSVDELMIRRAFKLSYWAHRNDQRASGELYISHPLAVARIVAREIRLDDTSVGAALLHDVVEDTDLTIEIIRSEFGEQMALLIDGLTKIRGIYTNRALGQAENVRKLILSMAQDVRVIFVKFADRLHNMKTLESLPHSKQLKIATETLSLFAPLAHRFGLQRIKSELEDLALKILEPEAYSTIVSGLKGSRQERESHILRFIVPLRNSLHKQGFEFEIKGRSKNLYSIFRKMRIQNKPLQEIYDVFAIRIILKTGGGKGKEDCWRVYSIVTDLYKPIPERFRDFISVPKSNGYQSLHTTVLDSEGHRMEVQIRTQEMHEIAERGVAAHWKYKEGVEGMDAKMDQFLSWVHDLMENPDTEQATEFVQEFSLDLYTDEIYVFTPRGDLKTLPKSATPVDFAFQIHTDVGFHCIGAKVNGKMVPLSHKLTSGDQVEIITSKKITANPGWIKFVVTHKARSQIRHRINEQRREAIRYGRQLWEKKAKRAKISLTEEELIRLATQFKYATPAQMFYEISSGLLDIQDLIQYLRTGNPPESEEVEVEEESPISFLEHAQYSGAEALLINGERIKGIATVYASCCNPIPGDAVFGYTSKSGSINIHRTGCRNAAHLLINYPDRIQSCTWSRQKDVRFVVGLRVIGEDRVGIIHDLTTVISRNLKTNIRSITLKTEDGFFEGTIILQVSDLKHLKRLIERIKRVDNVQGVYRFEE
ncbi:MAG: bifunctional (p)ppGpp synthetase/guanosine-3',5'-bis(diphosphate) 3'-pyrophosphohydrolase [Bacteroidetes bacterium]|nr:bifunctional (p)ppGpp synthetase/guanosine-3',5'-bis(diphosphate) 3'-pyrophosphohydrolase [Bacteroidota bacterium]MCY4204938.1 bifunctional (p)ppGpp synthetase/guanosine-3',5'-bis(diphosphate) 3'-pyrophosphohydrolase [Bacteroidota bacterium]